MKITRRQFGKAGAAVLGLGTLGSPVLSAAESIHRRPIPSSGEEIPIIGLGTNRYGVGPDPSTRAPLERALAKFHELGGTVVDTAPMYRSSESVLGDLFTKLGITDDLFIATKSDRSGGAAETAEQIEDSYEKLETETIDLMQVHNLINWREALPVMRDLKAQGSIRYVGITTSRSSQYGEFERIMRNEELDFVQVNYSLEQRESADRILPLAADRGMAVMINRAFGGGRLFETVGDQPLPDWAAAFDCDSWAQFMLNYALSHPAATVAIPGMTKARHVEDNMGAGRGRMPDAGERRRMEDFFDAL